MVAVYDVDLRGWYRQAATPFLDGNTPLVSRTLGVLNTPFEIPREASRTSGTAPLSVVFTAGFSSSNSTNRDFHDLVYLWDFGDTSSGIWPDSGKSRNLDLGGVASHLFEDAGTYNVGLTVINPFTGIILDTETFIITVAAADVTFAGTLTTVVNKVGDSDFTGAPSGATQINTDNLNDLTAYDGSGTRILLKRGSTWAHSGTIAFATSTLFHFGAYSAGTGADTRGIFSNNPIVNVTGASHPIDLSNKHDWRVTDIAFSLDAATPSITDGSIDIRQFLALRIKSTGGNGAISWSHWRQSADHKLTQNSVISCDISESYGIVCYIGSEYLTCMGNKIYNSEASHSLRVWQSYLGVILHNELSGASYTGAQGRHALKFHCIQESDVGTYAETGNVGLEQRSALSMVANNIFGGSGPWPLSLGPNAADADERLSDIIVEKNWTIADYGLLGTLLVQHGLLIEGRYCTARNNIADLTGGNASSNGVAIDRRGIEPVPLGNEVYNNTVYTQDTHNNGVSAVFIASSATETIVKNTFASFPNATGTKTLIDDNAADTVESNNQLNNTNGFTDPNNIAPLSRDFSLTLGAPAIDLGGSVPVYDDFDDTVITGNREQGAHNY